MFAVTNVDDLVLLALFFARAGSERRATWRVVAGQYLGFGAILVAAVVGALGVGLLPARVVPYLGLVLLVPGSRHGEGRRHGIPRRRPPCSGGATSSAGDGSSPGCPARSGRHRSRP